MHADADADADRREMDGLGGCEEKVVASVCLSMIVSHTFLRTKGDKGWSLSMEFSSLA